MRTESQDTPTLRGECWESSKGVANTLEGESRKRSVQENKWRKDSRLLELLLVYLSVSQMLTYLRIALRGLYGIPYLLILWEI